MKTPSHFQSVSKRLCPALFLALLRFAPANLPADDWPQWRGPNRDGVWNETNAMTSFPADGLKISWRAPVGRGWSSPVIAQGRVYLTDAQVTPPHATERVLCFEETTGRQLWMHSYAAAYPDWALTPPNTDGPRATPIVSDGKVVTLGAMGHLFCFNAVNGDVVWKKDLAQEYQVKDFTGITASPLIDDERLILYLCGKPAACVVAFNKNSGEEIWRALDDSFTYSSPVVLTAGRKKQLVIWTQEAVTALDPKTGRIWWREEIRTPGDMAVATPVFSNPWLLVGGLMFKLDAEKPAATVLWPENRAPTKRVLSNTSTAMLQGGYLYSAKIAGELVCLEAATGHLMWQTNTVTDLKNGASIHLTPNGDSVLLFTNEGNLIRARLRPDGYHELGRAHLLDPTYGYSARKVAWTPPAYANGHVVARNDQELIRASLASASR